LFFRVGGKLCRTAAQQCLPLIGVRVRVSRISLYVVAKLFIFSIEYLLGSIKIVLDIKQTLY